MLGAARLAQAPRSSGAIPNGQAVWWSADAGNSFDQNWTVPAGVTAISVVAIGGGGVAEPIFNEEFTEIIGYNQGGTGSLAYINNLAVTPGETLRVVVPARGSAGGTARLVRGTTDLLRAGGGNGGESGGAKGIAYVDPNLGTSRAAFNGADQGNGGAAKYTLSGDHPSNPGGPTSLNGSGDSNNRLCGAVFFNNSVTSSAGLRIIHGANRAFPNTNTGDIT